VLRLVTFLMDGSPARSGGRCLRLAAGSVAMSSVERRRAKREQRVTASTRREWKRTSPLQPRAKG
jgi:hypothetical protein